MPMAGAAPATVAGAAPVPVVAGAAPATVAGAAPVTVAGVVVPGTRLSSTPVVLARALTPQRLRLWHSNVHRRESHLVVAGDARAEAASVEALRERSFRFGERLLPLALGLVRWTLARLLLPGHE